MFLNVYSNGIKNAISYSKSVVPLCLMLTSCLVTDPIEFDNEQKNYPPSFIGETYPTIGSMVAVNRADFTGTGPKDLKFVIWVHDENIDQTLYARFKLSTLLTDYNPGIFDPQYVGKLPPSSGLPDRSFNLILDAEQLQAGRCYGLHLVVSSKFKDAHSAWNDPDIEGDSAEAKWLIAVSDSAGGAVDIKTCPVYEYKVVPTSDERDR